MKRVLCVCLMFAIAMPTLRGDEVDSQTEDANFFESKIRPVLVKHCYECHAGSNNEGSLRVDSRASIRTGGDRGPSVVPKLANASVLLAAISHDDADLKMPPKGPKLPDSVIADFRKWIESGAPDPRIHEPLDSGEPGGGIEPAKEHRGSDRSGSDHWAYQTPSAKAAPTVEEESWPRGNVDRFIWRAQSKQGLSASRDAQPRTLLRRLHFDLIGLPPSLAASDRFLSAIKASGIEEALQREVDQLLQSPQFGERWGRHWLDIARYAESSGGESNVSFPYAWRYRDYVIDAFNADLPYDRFLTEQVAGDLLPSENDAQRARLLTATGFLAVGTKNLGETNDAKFKADLVDEQIDSLTRAVMGSSVACARCHDHKFDPFSMEDYYALAGIFASSKTFFGTFTSPANNRGGDPLVLPRVSGQQVFNHSLTPKKFEELKTRQVELAVVRAAINEAREAAFAGKKPEKRFTLREVLANIWALGPVEGKLETLDGNGKALPVAMGVLDDKIIDMPLLARGEIGREGDLVKRAFPQAITIRDTPSIPDHQSGRLELARWLASPDHPLTSRVFVNRIWKHVFGQGLVSTVDNFGTSGSEPSHLDLLDTLAVQFAKDGWSTKTLIRKLVLSRTYRQASDFDELAFRKDPENAFLWRMPKRRLEAEAIRDAMLFAAGELDFQRPGGSLVATSIGDRPISLIGLDKKLPRDLDGATYRSVYLPVIRDRLPDVLDLFDFAEPSLVTGERETTNVPVQALYLMNSSFVQQRAAGLAQRLQNETTTDDQFIQRAFELCLGRIPDDRERQRSLDFLSNEHGWTKQSFCQGLLCTAEFQNLD